ncbi:MAG: hypothetical protein KME32_13605 [Mojavia pulchra JT2-VF2]|jgi:hypothetical protein|uniref:Uncharacterized protein n=1 Tax=Mojavia pulchra JT2-VF2 TaxID=287848 RepID=A0A951PZ47_9NOST|nr:hypothetical protein [Mojavia pulchra JT2-VF2]
MSYVSLLKNLPEILSQPTGIAAIASLGIHGAIALIVPLMPVDSNKSQESASSKTVGVLELSQADQNRLPQIPGTSPAPLQSPVPLESQIPSLNPDTQTAALPPLPAPPAPSQLVLPAIPKALDNYRISSLPQRQPLRIAPRGDFRFDTSGFKAKEKFSSSAPRFSNRDIAIAQTKPLPISKLPVLPEAKIPDGLLNSPSPNLSETTAATTPAITPDVNTTPQNTQLREDASKVAQNEQLVARIRETPQAGDNLLIARESIPQGQVGSTSAIPVELPAIGTEKALAQINSYENLRKAVQQQYPNAAEKAVIRESIVTDKPEQEGLVLGRLVVDPDGKVLDIKFETKLVSPALQLKTREYFNTHPLKGDKQIAHHPFSLEFRNNSDNAVGDTQKSSPVSALTAQPLPNPVVNSNQPLPVSAFTAKPLSNPTVNSNSQSLPAPTNTAKPLSNPVDNSQSLPTPTNTAKPLSNSTVNRNQLTPAPVDGLKPLSAPTPAATAKPLTTLDSNRNQTASSVESGKKLIRQLRELRQQRQGSNQEK